jgi:hypothetical protein
LIKAKGTAAGALGTGAVATVVLALALSGCAGATAAGPANHTTTTEASSSTSATAAPRTTTPATVPAQPGWSPVSTVATGVAVDERTVTTARGAAVTLIRFRAGQITFALHPGSQDPPNAAVSLGAAVPPSITAGEKPSLLGAFNGGFKVSGHAGGVEILGHVLTPLVAGMASLVIDTNGSAHIGVWGTTVPGPGEAVASVRQNLPPLVSGAQPSPSISSAGAWGDPLHENPVTARSALGQDAAGNLIYAGSLHALPVDVAGALLSAGVTVAMELDINPEWVQADVAASPGGALAAMVPGQNQAADRYLLGWTRDFVTVDVAPAALRPG